jgi:hypothetical protein
VRLCYFGAWIAFVPAGHALRLCLEGILSLRDAIPRPEGRDTKNLRDANPSRPTHSEKASHTKIMGIKRFPYSAEDQTTCF